MICLSCGSKNLTVIDTKLYEDGQYYKPVKCLSCGIIFSLRISRRTRKTRHERKGYRVKVIQKKDGEIVGQYESLTEASKATGVNVGNISNVLTGQRKTAGGFTWEYDGTGTTLRDASTDEHESERGQISSAPTEC